MLTYELRFMINIENTFTTKREMRVIFVCCQIHQQVLDRSYPKKNTYVYYDFSIEHINGRNILFFLA